MAREKVKAFSRGERKRDSIEGGERESSGRTTRERKRFGKWERENTPHGCIAIKKR
jgi:hypothetical protein